MKIQINKKEIESELCKELRSIFGFMFSIPFLVNKAKVLVFNKEKRISLHMLFVFMPLLVLFVQDNKVVEIKLLKPFTFYTSKNKARYAIEIPLKLVKPGFACGNKIRFIR
ncbi:MAG: DUF192 domain-containing protein [Nanoarchaeota archaeon]|nr:DUF192 domain-containing protein [Nanoarchaeota archaeon]